MCVWKTVCVYKNGVCVCVCVWKMVCVYKDGVPRPGAIAQSPGREAALAWASLAQRLVWALKEGKEEDNRG